MTAIRDFKDLLVWQKSIQLAKEIYLLTRRFPADEKFGLTAQIRRAVVSVSSNVAEGHSRQGKEFLNFLSIALGSLAEVESQLILAVQLDYLKLPDTAAAQNLSQEIRRMIASLRKKLTPNP